MNGYASAHCRFGEALELNEQQWLVWEINQHLKEARGRAPELADMPYTDAPEVGGRVGGLVAGDKRRRGKGGQARAGRPADPLLQLWEGKNWSTPATRLASCRFKRHL